MDGVRAVVDAAPLEGVLYDTEPPHAVDAEPVENATNRSIAVSDPPVRGFEAFLDGRQESRVIAWIEDHVPLILGTVSAGIQRREGRRLRSWSPPTIERRIYAPLALVDAKRLRAACAPLPVADTLTSDDLDGSPVHPTLLQERARQAVLRHREEGEQRLAAAWCARERSPLFVDGGIVGSEAVSASPWVVGVVKSHRTFYGRADAMRCALSLRSGERTGVVRVAPRGRRSVHSWYLRLREPAGHDVFWGLVRIEVAESDSPGERADLVSRWVLAERAPLAAPDARWDRMVYGIRAVEQALGAAAPSSGH